MKLTNTGQPISLNQAETYVEAYEPIKDALRSKILKKIDDNDMKDLKTRGFFFMYS